MILLNREGKINVQPGFDGEYGRLLLDGEVKRVFEFEPKGGKNSGVGENNGEENGGKVEEVKSSEVARDKQKKLF